MEYRVRKTEWMARRDLAQKAFIALGNWRLVTAVAAAAIAWLSFGRGAINAYWLIAPGCTFIALVVWHQRILRRRKFAERAVHFYEQALRRISGDWSGSGSQGEAFRKAEHIYADDLDVFGRGSLYEMLSLARTETGARELADWLLAPASINEAAGRQSAAEELAGKLDLREDMALLGEDIQSEWNARALGKWGETASIPFPALLRIGSLLLAAYGLAALLLRFAGVWPLWPLIAGLGLNAAIVFYWRERLRAVHAGIETGAHNLELLSLLIKRLEGEQFESPWLKRLTEQLLTNGRPASQRIRRLKFWLDLLDSGDHVLLRILNPVILYREQVLMALEEWRLHSGELIGGWIGALARFEAISSLGALHYERPHWCFPQLDAGEPPHLEAKDLAHPLLASSIGVANNVALNGSCRLLIVSGSNMSGKSTLLRAVGLNAVLAWAGAPVYAREMRISALQIAASLRVSDSLQDNRSRFFAEISRLRQIVNLTKEPLSVLFLLDELLSGTNSHDRRIGAAGIIHGLLQAKTLGMLTTHDLALTQLEQETGAAIMNFHFEDSIRNGKMEFDFKLRPGVVTHSNALELMRSIGLEV